MADTPRCPGCLAGAWGWLRRCAAAMRRAGCLLWHRRHLWGSGGRRSRPVWTSSDCNNPNPAIGSSRRCCTRSWSTCPAVRPALQWLARLWPRTGGGPAPPLSPKVWLQDSPAAWRPAPGSGELLAHLRVAGLEAAWRLRCRRQVTGQQFTAADVIDDVIFL
jgi:hypothetical protein